MAALIPNDLPAVNTDSTRQVQQAQLIRDQQIVRELATRDREVRAHEQAHAAAGGPHASHPHYQYTQGPNGVRYATAGHVNIDVSEVPGDPQATLAKMQTVVAAALAPAQPSPQDRAVAAKASAAASKARSEIAQQDQEVQNLAGRRELGSTSGSLLDVIV